MKKRLKKEFAEVNNQFNTCIDGIDERLKGVKEEFNSMIDDMNASLGDIFGNINALNVRELDIVTKDIARIENRLEILTEHINTLFEMTHTHWWK